MYKRFPGSCKDIFIYEFGLWYFRMFDCLACKQKKAKENKPENMKCPLNMMFFIVCGQLFPVYGAISFGDCQTKKMLIH